jgi:UDP-glucose 4-epimerase
VDEAHPCNPDHPYNITKLAGEHITMAYDHLRGVPVISLRLGTAYGTRMRPNSVFSIFITRALRGESLTIKGSGAQSRQFIHTSDVSQAFLRALESSLRAEVFNILGEEDISIRQLAEMVAESIPTSINYEEGRAGDIAPSRVSSQKAASMLDWKPETSFKEGLDKLIDWHRKNIK